MAIDFMKVKGGSVFLQRRGIMPACGVGKYPGPEIRLLKSSQPPPLSKGGPSEPILLLFKQPLDRDTRFRYVLDSDWSQRDVWWLFMRRAGGLLVGFFTVWGFSRAVARAAAGFVKSNGVKSFGVYSYKCVRR